jgi:hypothetical protein
MVPGHVTMDPPQNQDRAEGPTPGGRNDRQTGTLSPRLRLASRVGLLTLALGLTVVLATAGHLQPDPRGYGTHEQLGRPPCAILRLTGRPCPACGLTTSFAWFVRGELARSWRANPAGPFVASACVCLIPWLVASATCGRPLGVRSAGETLMAVVVVAAVLIVLTWLVRRSLSLI